MRPSSDRSGRSARSARCIALAVAAAVATDGGTARADGQIVSWGSAASGASIISIGSLLRYTQVSSGTAHTLALRGDGTVAAWGRNDRGQASVPTGLSNVRQVAAGGSHSIALLADGSVRVWGEPNFPQTLGSAYQGLVTQVAAGDVHSLYLLNDGRVGCAGLNSNGQAPSPLAPVSNATQVAAGLRHSVARLADSSVQAWGAGGPGGTNPNVDFGQSIVPPEIQGFAVEVDAGNYHTVARLADGRVRAWGRNDWGQRTVPSAVQGQAAAVAAGGDHTVALLKGGNVVAWGRNDAGQSPQPSGIAGASAVSAGDLFTTVLRRDGTIVAIGSNADGQCTVPDSRFDIVDVAAGTGHSLAVRADGSVIAWGDNSDGKTTVPTGLANVVEVAAGGVHSLARLDDRTVRAWGRNDASESTPPDDIQGLVTQLAAGFRHSLALLADGRVRWWGSNSNGQAPLDGTSVSNATQVAAGARHSVARLADSTVRAWGAGGPGGTNPTVDFGQSIVPADVQGVTLEVAAGTFHTVARRADLTVRCWGRQVEGQTTVPPVVQGQAVAIAAGGNYSVALLADGTIRAWGQVDAAQSAPPSGLGEVEKVAVGGSFALALLGPGRSGCGNPAGSGTARLTTSGAAWQNVGIWTWTDGGGPQVPGTLSNVTLGEFGSVGSQCDARCATLDVPTSSTLLVPVDLSQPLVGQNPSIDVGGRATLRGRVWLLANGGDQLPDDFSVPVVTAGEIDGAFSVIQSSARPPSGKFTTLVPSVGLGASGWSLTVRGLPGSSPPDSGAPSDVDGTVTAAAAIDADGDGFDDLVLAIDNGGQAPGILQVILNDGAGGLEPVGQPPVLIAPQPVSIAVGRLNADALDDIVVGTASDNAARAYLNASTSGLAGTVQFTPSTQFPVGGSPVAVAVVPPSQAQGQAKVAVGRRGTEGDNVVAASSISIFTAGSPTPSQTLTVPGGIGAMRGKIRILHGTGANPTTVDGLVTGNWVWALVEGEDGQFTLGAQVPVPGRPEALDVADVNGDGFDDVITANLDPDPAAPGTPRPVLTLFLGSASSPIGGPIPIEPSGASGCVDVALVDINDDGVRDIVSVNRSGTAGERVATFIPVNVNMDAAEQPPPGVPRPITLGDTSPVPGVENPARCPRGDVRGPGLEGVFFLAGGNAANVNGSGQRAVPFRAPPKKVPRCRPDFNDDGAVDGNDLGILLARWGFVDGDPTDLNGDGAVDGNDLGQLLAAWGPCPNS